MRRYFRMTLWIVLMLYIANTNSAFAHAPEKKKGDKKTEWEYEAKCVQVGVEGIKLIKIWSYSKKPTISQAEAWKNAVHAAVFSGFAANQLSGCPAQAPLVTDSAAEEQHADFFDAFFADAGEYMKYVNNASTEDGHADEVVKVTGRHKKSQYKIGVQVVIHYDELRKELERNGIIKSLSHGF